MLVAFSVFHEIERRVEPLPKCKTSVDEVLLVEHRPCDDAVITEWVAAEEFETEIRQASF